MITDNLSPEVLPMSLRYYEVMTINEDSKKKILNYLR